MPSSRRSYTHSPYPTANGITLVSPSGDRHSPPSAHQRWEQSLREEETRNRQAVVSGGLRSCGRITVDTSHHILSSSQEQQAAPLVGEVSVPFWVQSAEDTQWCSPDDWCAVEINKAVSPSDKAILWEMISALIQYPSLALPLSHVGCRDDESFSGVDISADYTIVIRNARDVASTFKRLEYRALWTTEAADLLPIEAAAEIIRAVYVMKDECLFHATYDVSDSQSLSEGF